MRNLKSVMVLTMVIFSSTFANAADFARQNCTVGTVSVGESGAAGFVLNCGGTNISFLKHEGFTPTILAAKTTHTKVSVKWTNFGGNNNNVPSEIEME